MDYSSLLREQLGEIVDIYTVKWVKEHDDYVVTVATPKWEELPERYKKMYSHIAYALWEVFKSMTYEYIKMIPDDELSSNYVAELLKVMRSE